MTMHGGRIPYDESGALQGPSRVLVASLTDVASSPASLWDIIPAKADVSGEYPALTGWRDIGLAVDAPQYTHGGTTAGLTYYQPSGELFQGITDITRTVEFHIADFREDNIQLLENTTSSSAVAAATGKSAGTKIPMGLYTDLLVMRVCLVTYRPPGSDAGVVEAAGQDPRPTAVAQVFPKAQMQLSDRSVSAGKAAPVDVAVQLRAQSDSSAPAGGEHGFWFIEAPGTLT